MANNNSGERIDFTAKVVELIYKRAGGACSVPRCKNPTMGPFLDNDGAVNMGEACHIYSAAVNGPRGRGGKDDDFIGSEDNGIWCCSYHAKLIDKSKGKDYPPHVLFAWKELAEARVKKKMTDMPSPLGWVDSITLTKFPTVSTPRTVNLSRFTLLWGRNASGKSVLMQMAASITNSKYAERFVSKGVNKSSSDVRFCAVVSYTTVDTLSKDISLQVAGERVARYEAGVRGLLPPGDLEVIYASGREQYIKVGDEDDIDLFARVINVDKSALYSLVDAGGDFLFPCDLRFVQGEDYDDDGDRCFPKVKQNGEPYYELICSPSGRNYSIKYDLLSGSEKDRLFLDFLIRKAREICKQRLTILLIDGMASSLDSGNFEKLLRILPNEDFQVCVCAAAGQEEVIFDFENGLPSLKPLDYLTPWQLRTLPRPFE